MKKLENLNLDPDAKKRIDLAVRMYRQNARIFIDVIFASPERVIVRVEQKEKVNEKILSKNDLEERIRQIFKNILPEDCKLIISANNFNTDDVEKVSVQYILDKMERLELKQKHIANYTGIGKSELSILLNEVRPLTKWHKATFYYLFKYLDFSHFSDKR